MEKSNTNPINFGKIQQMMKSKFSPSKNQDGVDKIRKEMEGKPFLIILNKEKVQKFEILTSKFKEGKIYCENNRNY